MNFETIPPEMKKFKNWVLWKLEPKINPKTKKPELDKLGNKKMTKVPYSDNTNKASTSDPDSWRTYSSVIGTFNYPKYKFDGIGFIFTKETGLIFIDMDNVRNIGNIESEALEEISLLNSYTEISQSGNGIHVIGKGTMPTAGNRKGSREMYSEKRFGAITGDIVSSHSTINDIQEASDLLYKKWGLEEKITVRVEGEYSPALPDDEIITLCKNSKNSEKFLNLFNQNFEDYKDLYNYPSHSEADLALVSILAFYTQSADQLDNLFRKSKLYRSKWDRDDYRNHTINEAFNGLTNIYKKEQLEEITESQLEEIRKEYCIKMPDLHNILDKNHFINIYCDWLSSLSDTYYEYQVGCAFWLLSSLTERKVQLKTKQEIIRPNIWAFILGRSTTSRKSTAIIKTKNIYENATDSVLFNDDYSVEGYLKLLEKQPVNNFVRDEVAGLLAKNYKKYNDGIFDLECTIYDGQDTKKTLSKEEVIVKDPYVTHLYGTTLDSFTENMQLYTVLGGYGFRFLYFAPDYVKPRKNIDIQTKEDIGKWGEVLTRTKELNKYFNESEVINFAVDPEAMRVYNHSVEEMEISVDKLRDRMLNSALGRYQIYILKLAMLIEIGKPEPSFCIHRESMDLSIKLIKDYFLPSYQDVINRLQEDAKNNQIEKVISVLRRMGNTGPRYLVLKNSKIKVKEFNEVLETLLASHTVSIKKIMNTGGNTREEIILER